MPGAPGDFLGLQVLKLAFDFSQHIFPKGLGRGYQGPPSLRIMFALSEDISGNIVSTARFVSDNENFAGACQEIDAHGE